MFHILEMNGEGTPATSKSAAATGPGAKPKHQTQNEETSPQTESAGSTKLPGFIALFLS